MNVYDKANELSKAIKESSEFTRYQNAAIKINKNDEHKKMIKDFLNLQYKFYTVQLQGQNPDEELMKEYNLLYTTMSNIVDVKEFLESQMYFARLMEDVQKSIAEATDTGVEFLKEDIIKANS